MVDSDPLFSLSQFDAQYLGKLSRYFNQVMGDFGPHQTIQLFKFLSPLPPFDPTGSSSSHNHL